MEWKLCDRITKKLQIGRSYFTTVKMSFTSILYPQFTHVISLHIIIKHGSYGGAFYKIMLDDVLQQCFTCLDRLLIRRQHAIVVNNNKLLVLKLKRHLQYYRQCSLTSRYNEFFLIPSGLKLGSGTHLDMFFLVMRFICLIDEV